MMTAKPLTVPPVTGKATTSRSVVIGAFLVTFICAAIGGWCGWNWISDPSGFDGDGGVMALMTFYVVAAVVVIVAAVISGGVGCGIFFAARAFILKRKSQAGD